jgi:hypothetical protein
MVLATLILVIAGPVVAVLLLITRRPDLNLISVFILAGLLWLILLSLAVWLLRGSDRNSNHSSVKRTYQMIGGALSILILAVLVIAGCWSLIVPRLIYSPRALPADQRSPDAWGHTGEQVHLRTPDGENLHGWLLTSTADAKSQCTVLFTHGNAGNVPSQAGFMRPFLAAGHDALIVDYRGYGASSGRPSQNGLYNDAVAAFDYLSASRGVRADHILIVGHSLGSAVATELATRRDGAGLILAAPFTSFPAVMNAHASWVPVSLLRWKDERFDSGSRIGRVRVPILIVSGVEDRLVPQRLSRQLYEAAPAPKTWVDVPSGHNQVFGSHLFARALTRFTDGISGCAASRDKSAAKQGEEAGRPAVLR